MKTYNPLGWQGLESFGKRIGELSKIGVMTTVNDDMSITMALPEDWKLVDRQPEGIFGALNPLGKSRTVLIIDHKGRERGVIVEAIADGDRHPKLIDARAFTFYRYGWGDRKTEGYDFVVTNAHGEVLHGLHGGLDPDEVAFSGLETWLDRHHPDWRDPSAYWD